MKLRPDLVRELFPAFAEPSLKRWAHFENAGGSYMAGPVYDRLTHFHRATRIQPGHPFPASMAGAQAMDEAWRVLSEIVNMSEEAIHIGPSTSANSYMLARAFRPLLKPGGNIILSLQDHEANSGYWRRMADEHDIEIREWGVDGEGLLEVEALFALCDERTIFAAFPHASNIIGAINPVADICKRLSEAGVISIVDGVSYAPHAWPDLAALGADIYLFSTYKTYGTHQGVMVIRPELAARLEAQGHYFNAEIGRKRLDPAGPDHGGIAALAGLGDYISAVYERHFKDSAKPGSMARRVSDLQRAHEEKHLTALLDALDDFPELRILGPKAANGRVPTISLYHKEVSGVKLAKGLGKHGIMAGGGDFYAPRLFRALGLAPEHGALRLSFVHYIKDKEIDQLIRALKKVVSG